MKCKSCDESMVLQCGVMLCSIELGLRSKISFGKGVIMIFGTVFP